MLLLLVSIRSPPSPTAPTQPFPPHPPAHRQVVGLAIGYSRAIEVDMAMCLQGNEESELPEVIFGGCKCRRVDMSVAKKI